MPNTQYAVGLNKTGPWLFGGLVGQFWPFAGDDERRDVSTYYVQPFVDYNLPPPSFCLTAARKWACCDPSV